MWHPASSIKLKQELAMLDMLDRVYEYRMDNSARDEDGCATRQQRRDEILKQLEKLKSKWGAAS